MPATRAFACAAEVRSVLRMCFVSIFVLATAFTGAARAQRCPNDTFRIVLPPAPRAGQPVGAQELAPFSVLSDRGPVHTNHTLPT